MGITSITCTWCIATGIIGVTGGYLISVIATAGVSGLAKSGSRLLPGLVESFILGLFSGLAVAFLIGAPASIRSILALSVGLLMLVSFYTLFSYGLYTLGLTSVFNNVMKASEIAGYAAETSSRIISVSLALLYSGALLVINTSTGFNVATGSKALVVGGLLIVISSIIAFYLSFHSKNYAGRIARVLSTGLLLAGAGLITTGFLVYLGLVTVYTGVFVGSMAFAIVLMLPLLVFFAGQLREDALELVGLEAFYRGAESGYTNGLEETVRLLLSVAPFASLIVDIIILILYLNNNVLTNVLFGIVSLGVLTGLSLTVLLRLSSGGLTGKVLPMAVWYASERLNKCLTDAEENLDPLVRGFVRGSIRYVCLQISGPVACIDSN